MQLGIDAGATSTKWSLAHAGQVIARGDAPALTGHLFSDAQQHDALARLRQLRARVLTACPSAAPRAVVAGVTGLHAGEAPALTLGSLLAAVFELPSEAVRVESDLHLTYLAYHPPGEGTLLYAGTGSIAYLLDAQGQAHRAGGYGYLLGDEGGAWWLARECLRRLLRMRDEGRPLPPILSAKLQGVLGSLDWPAVRARVYGAERGELARLAPLISEAALEGDPLARAVQRDGAWELARLVMCLTDAHPQRRVTACGGAITPPVFTLLAAELPGHQVSHGERRVSDSNAAFPLSGCTA